MWIAAAVQFVVTQLVVQSAWTTPYSWAHNAISDLGSVHCGMSGADNLPERYLCSPWHSAMNASIVMMGVGFAGGVLLTGFAWRWRRSTRAARLFFIGAGAGFVLAGLNPWDVDLDMHVLGAFLIMAGGGVGLLLAGLGSSDGPLCRLHGITLCAGIIALIATALQFSHHYLGLGIGGMERVAIFPLVLWMVVLGISILSQAPARNENIKA
jgi:hypothetical membrane protein